MNQSTTPLTSAQVKARLRGQGKTITQWAAEHGYDRQTVYRVLNGQLKAHWGRSHEIAVALGMKVPEGRGEASKSAAGGHEQWMAG